MKSTRQDAIIQIINRQEIVTQEELAAELRRQGYQVTQATVSRDIRELHLIKVSSERGGYKYARPVHRESAISDRLIRIMNDSMVSIDYAGQMIVVKTLSGSANIVGEAIDTLEWPEILGTIAGDNTIFIVMRNEKDAHDVAGRLRRISNPV